MKPGLFNWRYFFWLIPVNVFTVLVLIAPPPLTFGEAISWTFLALISHALMAIPFAIFRRIDWIIGKLRYEIGAMAIVGAVRGFAILDVGLLMDLPQLEPYLLRPLNSAVVVPTWFLVIHFLIGSRLEFAEDYRVLYLKLVRGNIERINVGKASANVKEIEQRLNAVLEPLRDKIELLHGNKISASRLAEESMIIQSFVEEKIRPLSHELWQHKQIQVPRLGFFALITFTLFRTKLPIALTIFPYTIFSLVGLASIIPLSDAFWYQSKTAALLMLIAYIYRYFYERISERAVLNTLAIILTLFLPLVTSRLMDSLLDFESVPALGELIGLIWIFFLLLSFGASLAVSKYHEEIMSVLRNQLKDVVIDSQAKESEEVSARFAKYLHGEVQSELLSASMMLSQAAKEKNSRIGRRGIEKTAEILRRDHSQYVVGSELVPEVRMQKIIDAWAGIAKIEIELVGTGVIQEDSLASLSDVVEELVSNSVRHGGASEISVKVSRKAGSLSVIFKDNGNKRGKGKPGLGSSLLKSLITEVKKVETQDGSVTTFQLIN
jgi:signal transduction histidine kinase